MKNNTIHIVPACGKLSAGIALLAKSLGFTVKCYDQSPQDPMLSQLRKHGLSVEKEWPDPNTIKNDLVVLGNTMGRYSAWVEACMDGGVTFMSMPQWLRQYVLKDRKVIVVAGTHGKTTVTSMVTFFLQKLGCDPGYLIGGQCPSLSASASLGSGEYFVIEGDEYDTAFFDKRAKLFWYWPHLALINNLEYDHMDIYPSIQDLYQTFQYWLRLVAPTGHILIDKSLASLGLVHEKQKADYFSAEDMIIQHDDLYQKFTLRLDKDYTCEWSLIGEVYVKNLIAAMKVVQSLGLSVSAALAHVNAYQSVDRRMTFVGRTDNIILYDDFAHHPTSIEKVMRLAFTQKKLLIIYPENYYMRSVEGLHAVSALAQAYSQKVIWLHNPRSAFSEDDGRAIFGDCFCMHSEDVANAVKSMMSPSNVVVTMSAKYLPELHQAILDINLAVQTDL